MRLGTPSYASSRPSDPAPGRGRGAVGRGLRDRYTTACQQLLALGAVLAVLTPAAAVLSLDVVGGAQVPVVEPLAPGAPAGERAPRGAATTADGAAAPVEAAPVEAAPVEPQVREVPMAPAPATPGEAPQDPTPAGPGTGAGGGPREVPGEVGREVSEAVEPVTGYGAVGVTWAPGEDVEEEDLALRVRTREGGRWSGWRELEFHDEHAPDPGSPEAAGVRPGSEPLLVGEVDEVQVQALTAPGEAPADLTLAVVTPGESAGTVTEVPELVAEDPAADAASAAPAADGGQDGLLLQSASTAVAAAASPTARPRIFSRRQWGAHESLRSGSPSYGEVHAGFIHHTVNANDYTKAQVPGILRSIYAYHTRSRGWSDIGYNFLVDRFGRVWEGRAGGIDQPVVGAHTLGYNERAFAVSAIGNFDVARPSAAMQEAIARVLAWKLSLHGVSADDRSQRVAGDSFPAVNGHRDAGSTACPGRFLYARVGAIRTRAAAVQQGWGVRERTADLVATGHPDAVLRRVRDGRVVLVPTAGLTRFERPATVARGGFWSRVQGLSVAPDLGTDGRPDVLTRGREGRWWRVPLGADGAPAARPRGLAVLDDHGLVVGIGDVTGDGRGDLAARAPQGTVRIFASTRAGGVEPLRRAGDWSAWDRATTVGDLTGDGRPDVLLRAGDRAALAARTDRGLAAPTPLRGDWGRWNGVVGRGDLTRDGRADLVVTDRRGQGWVLPRTARGFASPRGRVPVGGARAMAVAQVTGSRAADLLTLVGDSLVVRRNLGGTESLPRVVTDLRLPAATALLSVGDWDRDGDGDLVSRTSGGTLVLHASTGRGRFAVPVPLARGFSRVGALSGAGDVTGDGRPDLVGNVRGRGTVVWPGRGRDGLGSGRTVSGTPVEGLLGLGRFDGDGAPDVLARDGGSWRVVRGNGPGGLVGAGARGGGLAAYGSLGVAGDVTGDGRADLLGTDRGGRLWVLHRSGSGWATRTLLAEGLAGHVLAR